MQYDSNLDRLTVIDLRAIAADLKIAGRSKMKRAELVAVITRAEADAKRGVIDDAADEAAYIEEGLQADAEAGTYSFVNEVAILRDAPGRAIVTAAFDGRTVGGSIVRKGKRLVLKAGNITITATSFEKIAKRFALRLGFRADAIDVQQAF